MFASRFGWFSRVLESFIAFWVVLTARYGGYFRLAKSFGNFVHFWLSDGPSDRFALTGWNGQKLLPFGTALEGTTEGGNSEVSKR